MIRDLKFADIHAVVRFLEECHLRTHFARSGTASLDVAEAKRLIGAGISRHGHKGLGACWLQVSETNGIITGLIYGTLVRVYSIYDKLMATDLFWITSPLAEPGDAMKLMRNMMAWACSSPHVIEVRCGTTAIINDDYERAGVILARLGMKPYGAIYRIDVSGETQCLALSAASQKSSPPSEAALPN